MNKKVAESLMLPFMLMAMENDLIYSDIPEPQRDKVNDRQKLAQGLKKFEKSGKIVWALNQKSADKKFKKLGL